MAMVQPWRAVRDPHHLAVADVPDHAGLVAQPRDPQGDLLDGADHGPEVDHVADAELVLEDHEDAVEVVLHQGLRAEGQGHADDAGAGQQRGDVDVERREDHGGRDRPHADRDHAAQQLADGLRALLAPLGEQDRRELGGVRRALVAVDAVAPRGRGHPRDHPPDHPVQQHLHDQGDDHDDRDLHERGVVEPQREVLLRREHARRADRDRHLSPPAPARSTGPVKASTSAERSTERDTARAPCPTSPSRADAGSAGRRWSRAAARRTSCARAAGRRGCRRRRP